jgi:4-aminobutyrate aminotransferase-like enzyme
MSEHELVKEVRRIGAYIAIELPTAEAVNFCVHHALSEGLLIYFFLSTPCAFRVAPPLTMDEATWLRATGHSQSNVGCLLLLRCVNENGAE